MLGPISLIGTTSISVPNKELYRKFLERFHDQFIGNYCIRDGQAFRNCGDDRYESAVSFKDPLQFHRLKRALRIYEELRTFVREQGVM